MYVVACTSTSSVVTFVVLSAPARHATMSRVATVATAIPAFYMSCSMLSATVSAVVSVVNIVCWTRWIRRSLGWVIEISWVWYC